MLQNPCTFPKKDKSWWKSLEEALNAPQTLDVLDKEAVDKDDTDSRIGLGILQLIVMKKAPDELDGDWSPLLAKLASCEKVALAIADFLLQPFSKPELMGEVRGLLAANLAYLTPSTVSYLEDKKLMTPKAQQHHRLKVTFCVHDLFQDKAGSLLDVTATLKSPPMLLDAFLNAVIRRM